jgi:hypothetical protein
MAPTARPRPVLFILVSILLVASGVVFSRFGSSPEAESGRAGDASRAEVTEAGRVALETARLRAQVEQAARHFMPPYFRYEVGDIDARVRRELRATATPEFAAALLAVPPRAPAGGEFPLPARAQGFEINFSQSTAFHAFVDVAARRGAVAERLSFEFEYGDRGWRASGVTE